MRDRSPISRMKVKRMRLSPGTFCPAKRKRRGPMHRCLRTGVCMQKASAVTCVQNSMFQTVTARISLMSRIHERIPLLKWRKIPWICPVWCWGFGVPHRSVKCPKKAPGVSSGSCLTETACLRASLSRFNIDVIAVKPVNHGPIPLWESEQWLQEAN